MGMENVSTSPGDWVLRGEAAQVLALAALAFATSRYAHAGWELLGYGIAIIEGPPEGLAGPAPRFGRADWLN